jgi:hypothetical protein
MDKFPETGNTSDFLGQINMTTNEAISLCVNVIKNMGYTNKLGIPIISYAPGMGSVVCTRFSYYWRHAGADQQFASFEVDMETRSIKSIFLRDSAFERDAPKIDLPLTNAAVTAEHTP